MEDNNQVKGWISFLVDFNSRLYLMPPEEAAYATQALSMERYAETWQVVDNKRHTIDEGTEVSIISVFIDRLGRCNFNAAIRSAKEPTFVQLSLGTLEDVLPKTFSEMERLAVEAGLKRDFSAQAQRVIANRAVFANSINQLMADHDQVVLNEWQLSEEKIKEQHYSGNEKAGMF